MDVVDELYFWTNHGLYYALIAIRLWALIDCLTRRSAAFTAVDKLTKPAWVAILLFGGLLGTVFSAPYTGAVVQIIPLVSVVAAAVYLVDVRPAVRAVSGGR